MTDFALAVASFLWYWAACYALWAALDLAVYRRVSWAKNGGWTAAIAIAAWVDPIGRLVAWLAA